MLFVLVYVCLKYLLSCARPVVFECLVVRFLHEAINADEIEEAIRTTGGRDIRRHERVVHGCEPLLPVQYDVFGSALPLEAINGLAGERHAVFFLSLPKQQTADEVVEENGANELADIPRLPFELALEIRNNVATFLEPADERRQG